MSCMTAPHAAAAGLLFALLFTPFQGLGISNPAHIDATVGSHSGGTSVMMQWLLNGILWLHGLWRVAVLLQIVKVLQRLDLPSATITPIHDDWGPHWLCRNDRCTVAISGRPGTR